MVKVSSSQGAPQQAILLVLDPAAPFQVSGSKFQDTPAAATASWSAAALRRFRKVCGSRKAPEELEHSKTLREGDIMMRPSRFITDPPNDLVEVWNVKSGW